jgi:hypothetical protein
LDEEVLQAKLRQALAKGSSTQLLELEALVAKPISHTPQKHFGDFPSKIYLYNILKSKTKKFTFIHGKNYGISKI